MNTLSEGGSITHLISPEEARYVLQKSEWDLRQKQVEVCRFLPKHSVLFLPHIIQPVLRVH